MGFVGEYGCIISESLVFPSGQFSLGMEHNFCLVTHSDLGAIKIDLLLIFFPFICTCPIIITIDLEWLVGL